MRLSNEPARLRREAVTLALRRVAFEGNRYVVEADLGIGRSVPLMVHGNARLFLQLSHDVAAQVVGRPVEALDSYGYTGRGRGAIEVPTLRLGGVTVGVPGPVPVFDLTDDADPPAQGMLGTRFLVAARAVLDFRTDTLRLGAGPGGADERSPRDRHQVALQRTPDDRLTVDVRFPAIDRALPIVASTVANALTLHRPLFAGGVAMVEAASDLSPDGTRPAVATTESIAFEVGGVACRAAASFEDLAEYGNVAEPELEAYGMLGFDWMKEHAAVLDYEALTLSFRP